MISKRFMAGRFSTARTFSARRPIGRQSYGHFQPAFHRRFSPRPYDAPMKRMQIAWRCVVALLLGAPSTAFAAPGYLDPAFGQSGFVVFPHETYAATDIKIQPDGRILISADMAGLAGGIGGFSVVRLLPNGNTDTAFGNAGLAVARFGSGLNTAESLAIQPDGKIVAAGLSNNAAQGNSEAMAIARFRPSGALDLSFGSSGTVQFVAPRSTSSLATVVIALPSRKLLVGGQAQSGSGPHGIIVRLNPNGAVDTTFGSGGVATFASPFGVTAIGVQSDGKIVALTGHNATRLKPDGLVDSRQPRGTIVDEAHFGAAMLTPDEKILEALPVHDSQSQNDIDTQSFRLFPNGTNDPSFATPIFDFINRAGDGFENGPFAIVLQGDGSPIIAGQGQDEATITEGALARLTPGGHLDLGFGNGGTVASALDGDDQFTTIALQPDGKIVAAGISLTSTGGLVIARYLSQ
jgi:uncharacterized delta-60 repeat protein